MACGESLCCHPVSPGAGGTLPPPKLAFISLFPPRYLLEQVKRREGFRLVMEVGMTWNVGWGMWTPESWRVGMPQV